MNDKHLFDVSDQEIRRYIKAYVGSSRVYLDPAVLDDLLDSTLSVLSRKQQTASLTCKPTTFAVAVFKRQLKAYWRSQLCPPGSTPKGRPRAERFSGQKLRNKVREACLAELRAGGLFGSEIEARLRHLSGTVALRTQIVRAVDACRALGEQPMSDRQLAAVSLLVGCFPKIAAHTCKSVGEILSSEIEAIRRARERVARRMSEEIQH